LESVDIEILSSLLSKIHDKKANSTVTSYIEKLCKTKCGKLPETATDCKGIIDENYNCKVKLVSDNFDFHFEKMWKDFYARINTSSIDIGS
jgi:hypothetical protein